ETPHVTLRTSGCAWSTSSAPTEKAGDSLQDRSSTDFMTIVEWCKALEDTRVGEVVRETAFPYVEGVHVLGLALSVGTVVWFDLRLLGATMRTRPVTEVFRNLKGRMIAGFSLMFLSGALLFTAH